MKRVILIPLLLAPIFAVLSTFAIFAGGRASPDWQPYFGDVNVQGGRLTYMGIRPGITTMNEAQIILARYGNLSLITRADWHSVRIGADIVELATLDGVIVDGIAIRTPTITLPLVVARLGRPCASEERRLRVWYPYFMLQQLSPDLHLLYAFGDGKNVCELARQNYGEWRGFRRE
jgi:hypothetical protein